MKRIEGQIHLFLDQHQHKSNSLRNRRTLDGISDGDFDRGVLGIVGKFTPLDPDGAVIRVNHRIAVGRGLRLWVGQRPVALRRCQTH